MTRSGARGSGAAVALVAVAGLVLAGCGGGSSPKAAPSSAKQLASDKVLAQQAMLRLADLPTGYASSPASASPTDDVPAAVASKFAACVQLPVAVASNFLNEHAGPGAVLVRAPNFNHGSVSSGDISFQSNVAISRSAKDLADEVSKLGAAGAVPCWTDFFRAGLTGSANSNTSYRNLVVAPLAIGSVGDQMAAFEAKVNVTLAGHTTDATIDVFVVRRGRAIVAMFATGLGVSVDHSLERSLLQKVAGRLDAAA